MATVSKANKPRKSSLLTRNNRVRILPLSINQLTALLEKTAKKTTKAKISTRLRNLTTKLA